MEEKEEPDITIPGEGLETAKMYMKEKGVSPAAFAKRFIKIYNSMDSRCKMLARSNPRRHWSEYCPRCKEKIRDILEV